MRTRSLRCAPIGVEFPQPLRPIISALVVAAFVGLNLHSVHETGLFEDVAVYLKVLVLPSQYPIVVYQLYRTDVGKSATDTRDEIDGRFFCEFTDTTSWTRTVDR